MVWGYVVSEIVVWVLFDKVNFYVYMVYGMWDLIDIFVVLYSDLVR